jgi:hypothetical protein
MLKPVKKSQDLNKNRPWLTFLKLVTLGTVVLAVCAFLLGCGSDSTPGGAAKGKNAKAAATNDTKMPPATSLLTDTEGRASEKMGKIKHHPESPESNVVEPFIDLTPEEIDARQAADRKMLEGHDIELSPGLTKEQLDAKQAEDFKIYESQNRELSPGLTQAQLDAKQAEDFKIYESQNRELSPGLTQAQLDAKQAEDLKIYESQNRGGGSGLPQAKPGAQGTK